MFFKKKNFCYFCNTFEIAMFSQVNTHNIHLLQSIIIIPQNARANIIVESMIEHLSRIKSIRHNLSYHCSCVLLLLPNKFLLFGSAFSLRFFYSLTKHHHVGRKKKWVCT